MLLIYLLYLDQLMENSPVESLDALEQRIAAKQQANLELFRKQILKELNALKEALLLESKTSSVVAGSANDEKLDKRITELQTENRRLEYRVTHLSRNLRQALQKQ